MKEINNIGLWECVKSIHPNADFSIYCGEIIWREKNIKCPTKEELEAEQKKLLTDYDSKAYARARSDAYETISEQLDMIYWDKVNGTNKWQEAVAKVKADNPKPE